MSANQVRSLPAMNPFSDHDFGRFTQKHTALVGSKVAPGTRLFQIRGWYFVVDSLVDHIPAPCYSSPANITPAHHSFQGYLNLLYSKKHRTTSRTLFGNNTVKASAYDLHKSRFRHFHTPIPLKCSEMRHKAIISSAGPPPRPLPVHNNVHGCP